MSRKMLLVALTLGPLAFAQLMAAQDRGSKSGRIDVDHYAIDAEINPRTQTLTANVKGPIGNLITLASSSNTTLAVTGSGKLASGAGGVVGAQTTFGR